MLFTIFASIVIKEKTKLDWSYKLFITITLMDNNKNKLKYFFTFWLLKVILILQPVSVISTGFIRTYCIVT